MFADFRAASGHGVQFVFEIVNFSSLYLFTFISLNLIINEYFTLNRF